MVEEHQKAISRIAQTRQEITILGRSTQTYAKVTDDKISEDMDRLMEKRKKQN